MPGRILIVEGDEVVRIALCRGLHALGIDVDEFGPEHLQPYISFDLSAFARALSIDYRISEGGEGVHVFDY